MSSASPLFPYRLFSFGSASPSPTSLSSLISFANPIGAVFEFTAQLQIQELIVKFTAQLQIQELIVNTILTGGFKAKLHIHAIVEECEIVELLEEIDTRRRKTLKMTNKKPLFVKSGAVVLCRIQVCAIRFD